MSLTGDNNLDRASGLFRILLSRATSRNRRVARLYVAKRRAKPMVSAFGFEHLGVVAARPTGALRGRAAARPRSRMKAIRRRLRRRCAPRVPGREFLYQPQISVVVALAPVRMEDIDRRVWPDRLYPARQMHAVGDGSERDFPDRQVGPKLLAHFLRDLAMQPAPRCGKRTSGSPAWPSRSGLPR